MQSFIFENQNFWQTNRFAVTFVFGSRPYLGIYHQTESIYIIRVWVSVRGYISKNVRSTFSRPVARSRCWVYQFDWLFSGQNFNKSTDKVSTQIPAKSFCILSAHDARRVNPWTMNMQPLELVRSCIIIIMLCSSLSLSLLSSLLVGQCLHRRRRYVVIY